MENALNLLFSLKNSITPMCAPSKLCGFGRGAPPPGCPRRETLGRRAPSRCPWGKGAQLQAQVSCNPCTPAPLPSALYPHDSCATAQGRWPKAAAAAALLQSQRGASPVLQRCVAQAIGAAAQWQRRWLWRWRKTQRQVRRCNLLQGVGAGEQDQEKLRLNKWVFEISLH